MSEFELLELVDLSLSRAWSHMQWWGGVSFGLIAVAHFAGKKLNLLYVAFLSVLYIAFSFYAYANLSLAVGLTGVYITTLESLVDTGELSEAGTAALRVYEDTGPRVAGWIQIAVFGLFIASLAFLFLTFWNLRKPKK
jgi:hypothetical protein